MKLYRKFNKKGNLVVLGREVGFYDLLEMFACLMEQDKKSKKEFKELGFKSGGDFLERLTK